MARHLVSLKLALMKAALRRGRTVGKVAFGIFIAIAVSFGGVGALALASMRTIQPQTATDIVAVVFALLLLGWAFGPLLALAADNTLDIDRLSLFPLTPRQLMPGLLIAAAVGIGGLFTSLVLLGAFIGVAHGVLVTFVAALAILEFFGLCLATSRLLSTSLSAATGKRRWRDVALFVGPLLAIGFNLTFQLVNRRLTDPSHPGHFKEGPGLRAARTVFRWVPTGWPAQAIAAARDGRYAVSLLALAATAALIVICIALWWRAIQTVTTEAAERGGMRRATRTALVPRAVGWLPRNALGAIVARDLRYSWRDPRRRAAVVGTAFAALVPLVAFRGLANGGVRLPLVAAWPALNLAANPNVFGFDADRVWVDVAAGIRLRTQLVARLVSRAIYSAPFIVIILGGFALLGHTLAGIVPATGLIVAVTGVGYGFGSLLSVRTPVPMPDETRGNVFGGGNSGQNASAGTAALGEMLATALVVAPVLIASLVLPSGSAAQYVVAAAGMSEGAIVLLVCVRFATPLRTGSEADVLAKLVRA